MSITQSVGEKIVLQMALSIIQTGTVSCLVVIDFFQNTPE